MSKEVTRIEQPSATAPTPAPVPQYSFEQIQRMAVAFAKSGLFGVKEPEQALSLMMYAQATGKHPAKIMMEYDLIQGRLVKKATAMLHDFQLSGGRVEWIELSDTKASAKFSHPFSATPITIDWDIARAEKAGLSKKDGSMYHKYTRSMLRSRCISEGIRSIAPEATEQLYTVEEVQAMETEAPEPVSVETAVAEAAAEVQQEMAAEEFDELVSTLDVATRAELVSAYNAGIKVLAERGNHAQFIKFKAWRDDMLNAIESNG